MIRDFLTTLSFGFITSGFNQSQSERYTVYAMGEAQLLGAPRKVEKGKKRKERVPHDLQFGLQYAWALLHTFLKTWYRLQKHSKIRYVLNQKLIPDPLLFYNPHSSTSTS